MLCCSCYLFWRALASKSRRSAKHTKHIILSSYKCQELDCDELSRQIERNSAHAFSTACPEIIEQIYLPPQILTRNRFGMPEIRSLLMYAYQVHPRAETYTYVNSDILIDGSLCDTVTAVSKAMKNIDFVVVGARKDVLWEKDMHTIPFIDNYQSGTFARTDAIDYFITTKRAIPWESIPRFVLGRPAYDNWLVNYAAQSPRVVLIDATKTIKVVHQSKEEGLDHWERMDDIVNRDYNRELARGRFHTGYIDHAQCYTKYTYMRDIHLAGDCDVTASKI